MRFHSSFSRAASAVLTAGLLLWSAGQAQTDSSLGADLAPDASAEERQALLVELSEILERDGSVATWPVVEALVARDDLPVEFRSQALREGMLAARAQGDVEYREASDAIVPELLERLPAGSERSLLLQSWAVVEIDRSRFPQAEALLRQSIQEAAERPMEDRASLVNSLGVALAQQGRLDEALETMLESYAVYEQTEAGPDAMMMANIGGLSIYLENWDQAVEFSRRAIEAFGPDHPRTPPTYNNLAAALIERGDQDEAREMLERGIEIAERNGRSVASLRNNLGYLLREQGRFQEALDQFEAAAQLNREEGDPGALGISEKNIGETLIELGRREEAANALDRSLALYREADIKPKRLELYPVMVENLEALGRYPAALALSREWRDLTEELASAEAQTRVAELQTAFDLERSERELAEANQARLQREAELVELQAEQSVQRFLRWFLIAGVAVLVLFLFILVRSLRLRTLANRLLAEKNAEIDVQRKALSEANALLHRQSHQDDLTGLGNRRSVRRLLASDLSDAVRRDPCLVVLIDLDRFKQINDRYGHPAGDRVLAQFAGLLRDVAGPDDVLARWGGEEFLWLVATAGVEDAARHCAALLDRVRRETVEIDGQPVDLSCSMGVAPADLRADAPQDEFALALKVADAALYDAKQGGRDRWVAFDRQAPDRDVYEGSLDLEQLIERGALVRIED